MKFHIKKILFLLIFVFVMLFCWIFFLSNSSNRLSKLVDNSVQFDLRGENNNLLENTAANLSNNRTQSDQKSSETLKSSSNEYETKDLEKIFGRNQFNRKIANIVCDINGEYKIDCLRLKNSKETIVYVPFSLIRKYFEINGRIVKSDNQGEYFEWNHSYSKIFYPSVPYSYDGEFLWFGNYNVEFRDRVKCISPVDHVPVSTQWHAVGHLYPTQISQYGLSHFTKNITSPKPNVFTIIDQGSFDVKKFSRFAYKSVAAKQNNFVSFENLIVDLTSKNLTNYLIAKLDIKFLDPNSTISFQILNLSENRILQIVFTKSELHNELHSLDQTIVSGIGPENQKSNSILLTRDLLIDLFKNRLISDRKRSNYCVVKIFTDGSVQIRTLSLKTSAHGEFALAAGEWLVKNQNELGGWPIKVKRKFAKGALSINEGWHSAMSQGQAISLLVRLYSRTSDPKYLKIAKKALKLFEIESYRNGIKAMLFDKYTWFEEYPTAPSIFVLNGFIYSLFGLYDLSKICDDTFCQRSGKLFDIGIQSLEAALPLFDSGSGSFYDLRHLSLGIAPNLARWDYHSTHINQLLHLYTIVRGDIIQTTAERWIGYMKGHRASHN